jgi:hypothetical protein
MSEERLVGQNLYTDWIAKYGEVSVPEALVLQSIIEENNLIDWSEADLKEVQLVVAISKRMKEEQNER